MFLRQLMLAMARRAAERNRIPRAEGLPSNVQGGVGPVGKDGGTLPPPPTGLASTVAAIGGPPKDRILKLIEGGCEDAALDTFNTLSVAERQELLEEELKQLSNIERAQLTDKLGVYLKNKWNPHVGPQSKCVASPADIVLYGGAAGGGKSDLLLGLSVMQHKRSLIIRRQYSDLGFLVERLLEINKSRSGFVGGTRPTLRTSDGRLVEFGACLHPGDEQAWQGQPHDFLGIDEAAQLHESQVRYLMGWVRSTDAGQRTRIVFASNPPLSDEGFWLVRMFAPWIDPQHPNPAKPGELRWFISDEEGNDREVDGRGPHLVGSREVLAISRTYIPAKLADNPKLNTPAYQAKLDSYQEPMRSAMRDGNFLASRLDDIWQVIPSDWIRQAQERWKPTPPAGQDMTCIALDPAGGGHDAAAIAYRRGTWFGEVVTLKGKETSDGAYVVARLLMLRDNACQTVVDVGGGYGFEAVNALKRNQEPLMNAERVVAYRGSDASTAKATGSGIKYANRRAQDWYQMREALDPLCPDKIALPPDAELAADLSTPRIDARALQTRGVYNIESKEDIRTRLGRSPDKGDAVVMCHAFGGLLAQKRKTTHRYQAHANVSPAAAKRYGWRH